ncbi:hypothetical protein QTO34_002284 [Cnephaeus nilssonii]|uniref:Uncharacterized protein n=1 Tax=Cnephaeus nilssonii TaxID=3371016 RepID=A0AA40LL39_CNENI|nr:hypothetical protein QTO34_002284 [Eptesicus nilssonii]
MPLDEKAAACAFACHSASLPSRNLPQFVSNELLEEAFFVFSQFVTGEPMDQLDDEGGLPEKLVISNFTRSGSSHVGSFDYEYAIEMEKQQQDQVDCIKKAYGDGGCCHANEASRRTSEDGRATQPRMTKTCGNCRKDSREGDLPDVREQEIQDGPDGYERYINNRGATPLAPVPAGIPAPPGPATVMPDGTLGLTPPTTEHFGDQKTEASPKPAQAPAQALPFLSSVDTTTYKHSVASVRCKDDDGGDRRFQGPVQVGEALDVQHVDLINKEHTWNQLSNALINVLEAVEGKTEKPCAHGAPIPVAETITKTLQKITTMKKNGEVVLAAPIVNFHCPEETSAGHPGSSPRRPCSAPQPPAARQPTSRAFSWPTSPEAACLAKPLSSSPSPFTWLWEAMRCVFVVLFTSSIFILYRSGAQTSVGNQERVTHARNPGYHAAVTRRLVRARLVRRSIGGGGNASALHWLVAGPPHLLPSVFTDFHSPHPVFGRGRDAGATQTGQPSLGFDLGLTHCQEVRVIIVPSYTFRIGTSCASAKLRWEEPGEQHSIRRLRWSPVLGHPPSALCLAVPIGARKAETSGRNWNVCRAGDGGDSLKDRTAAAAAGGANRLVFRVAAAWQGCG